MTQQQVRSLVGLLLVLGQMLLILYILLCLKDLFLPDQVFELISLITPLFSAYLVIVTKAFLTEHRNVSQKKVGFNYIFISLFYPVIFISMLFISIKLYDNQTIESFVFLKKIIGVIETSFGVYLGLVLDKLFPAKK